MNEKLYKLGIDIGSTTVKIAILDEQDNLIFSDYERHFANIQETLSNLLHKAFDSTGEIMVSPMITGSGGLTLAKHLGIDFVQEVIAVSTALTHYAPQPDVAIELGGEDAKIIYFENGNVVYLTRQISSPSSTMEPPRKTCLPPFSRRLSTRPFPVLPAVSRSAVMLPF